MIKKAAAVIIIANLIIANAYAASYFGGIDPNESPSVFSYAWSGLRTGALCGASIGGLQAAHEHEYLDDKGEANRVVNGALYGVIGGTVLGLGVGFYDLAHGQTGIGGIILRDADLGGGLGIIVGAAVGGITYSKTKDWGDFGQSVALGYICGVGLGIIFGLIEGPQITAKNPEQSEPAIKLAMLIDTRGALIPALSYNIKF